MASEITVQGRLQISKNGTTAAGNKTFNLDLSGSNYAAETQSIGTATATMTLAGLTNLRYAYLYNSSSNTCTITMAAITLKPGDVAVFPPSTSAVTLQATTASTGIEKVITEA